MNTYAWLVRREFWENRAIWMIPAAIAAALTFGALFGRVEVANLTSPAQSRAVAEMILFAVGVVFFLVMSIYSTWYLLDCLYADRKDRSVLFWKSMPISDTATVLAKLFTGLIAIPVVYFAAADLSALLMAFVVALRARSSLGAALWQADLWLQLQGLCAYVIVSTAVWYLPVAGWLLLVSAWAKRAVMLWSVLPLLAAVLAERLFLGSHVVANLLKDRLAGYVSMAFRDLAHRSDWVTTPLGDGDSIVTPTSVWRLLDPVGFFSSPATWIGVLVGAALIYGAIQLRLRRTET
jgi:ABC-2 type transport system permease protein